MQVADNDIKKYITPLRKINDNAVHGWEMKRFKSDCVDGNSVFLDGNSVVLIQLEKGQTFRETPKGSRGQVALQKCFVVDYMLNNIGTIEVFPADDMQGAIDLTMKLIALIKA